MVISGNHKGQSGRILMVDTEKQRAIVEGVNLVSKHTRPNADNPKGGIVKKEATIHVSNLKLIDKSGQLHGAEQKLVPNVLDANGHA